MLQSGSFASVRTRERMVSQFQRDIQQFDIPIGVKHDMQLHTEGILARLAKQPDASSRPKVTETVLYFYSTRAGRVGKLWSKSGPASCLYVTNE